jgi:PKHD-type hydroxylase
MNLKYQYWYFNGVLPERFCDLVLRRGLVQQRNTAYIGNMGDRKEKLTSKDYQNLNKKRQSKVLWLNYNWIYRIIHPFIDEANENAGWNFQWDWTETSQFTEYKPGQFYGWHQDANPAPYHKESPVNFVGKIRKLSCSILLNHPHEYKGGELQFNLRNNVEDDEVITATEAQLKGSIIVFPSFVWHQVKPVTEGTRYSLVTWHLGQPWK